MVRSLIQTYQSGVDGALADLAEGLDEVLGPSRTAVAIVHPLQDVVQVNLLSAHRRALGDRGLYLSEELGV